MQIDRSKFLVLTTVISAAVLGATTGATGCSSSSSKADVGGADATTPDTGGESTDAAANIDSASDSGPCLTNDDTKTASCSAPNGDRRVVAGCDGICSLWIQWLKTDVAEAMVDCLSTRTQCDNESTKACAEGAFARACPEPTAAAYCDDLATQCAVDGGGDAGDAGDAGDGASLKTKCLAVASAFTDQGRSRFTDCVIESDCSRPIDSCIADTQGRSGP